MHPYVLAANLKVSTSGNEGSTTKAALGAIPQKVDCFIGVYMGTSVTSLLHAAVQWVPFVVHVQSCTPAGRAHLGTSGRPVDSNMFNSKTMPRVRVTLACLLPKPPLAPSGPLLLLRQRRVLSLTFQGVPSPSLTQM